MGLFDEYIPDPPLDCPVCGSPLNRWQGKDGPNALMVWRQGCAGPVDQRVPEELRLDPGELAKLRLPGQFTIYTQCCGGRFFVEARCRTEDGIWAQTDLMTAENAVQKTRESRGDFEARLRWLRGVNH
ncbi:hypothetical protein [Pelagibius sp.]|uniref:hypothetical protein n=1 Tax=Pelagibius sp. TaxID=1931238 RepID=UPI0026078DCA|nr:hypothetical protein [Pelagibius sp.]